MLVPLFNPTPPPGTVERTQVPGAAMSTSAPKFEYPAKASSVPPLEQVAAAPPPGLPSKSEKAETVIASAYVAGTVDAASTPLLPAATTTGTPAPTTLQMALW